MKEQRSRFIVRAIVISGIVLGGMLPAYAAEEAAPSPIVIPTKPSAAATAEEIMPEPVVGGEYIPPAGEDEPITIKDPYEGFNRAMYKFNDFLDTYVLKPVSNLYLKVVPKPFVKGITNFYYNIDTIPTVINDALQTNFYQTTSDFWRLAINSTIGIVGFFDVATDIGLEPNKEDFGLTLARWGYTNSNYLVLPFLGPSTVRDGIGIPVDFYAFSIYPHIKSVQKRNVLYGIGVVSRRAELLRYENVMEQAAVDKYVFLRDAYLQRRNYLIQRNKELNDPYLDKNKVEVEDKNKLQAED